MNWLMPEPASDIRAQIDALFDRRHPKTAVFLAPGNQGLSEAVNGMWAARREGTLLTHDASLREAFLREMPDEAGMAAILGYPESKNAVMAACPESWVRVVQACDWKGNVITEALCSPGWLVRTKLALAPHGNIRILTVDEVLGRRFAMRCAEAA